MTCPNCSTKLTADDFPVDGRIGVCHHCARSIAKYRVDSDASSDALRLATSADLEHLSDAQIQQLRKARPSNWRQAVRARHAQIVGK